LVTDQFGQGFNMNFGVGPDEIADCEIFSLGPTELDGNHVVTPHYSLCIEGLPAAATAESG
jgi:hypothetical protein